LNEQFGTAIIMITHDLGVIAEIADEVVVMYAGTVMEVAPRREVFYEHHHPYTEGLLRSLPGARGEGERLVPIDGQPPSPIDPPPGCPFAPRCPYRHEPCIIERPTLALVGGQPEHRSACWLPKGPAEREALRASVSGSTRVDLRASR
jgi:oligopeptide/dipeptide ABC transporter ATP-binding protein